MARLRKRLSLLRHRLLGRELSRSLRESLLVDVQLDGESGWVVRNEGMQAATYTQLDYTVDGDREKVRWSIKLYPSRRCCFVACGPIEVRADNAVIPIPFLQRYLLRNAAWLFVLRYANRHLDKTIGN